MWPNFILLFLSLLISQFLSNEATAQSCQKDLVYLEKIPACKQGDYRLLFEDNFDGQALNQNTWIVETGVPRDPNFDAQKAWHQSDNIQVSNGSLKIIAKREAQPKEGTWVIDWSTNPFTTKTASFEHTTAEIRTKDEFHFGKYEARCRMTEGSGLWPAFWVFGAHRVWNEIDFFELYGDDMDRFTCNIHHDYDYDGDSEMCGFALNRAVKSFSDWHVYTVIHDYDRIIWQIDGKTVREFFRFSDTKGNPIFCGQNDLPAGVYQVQKAFPDDSMHLVLNLAVQPKKIKNLDKSWEEGVFEIDYVRYWVKTDASNPPPVNAENPQSKPLQAKEIKELRAANIVPNMQNSLEITQGQVLNNYRFIYSQKPLQRSFHSSFLHINTFYIPVIRLVDIESFTRQRYKD